MPVILAICSFLGINPLRLLIYAALFVAVVTGALWVRHHYVALGYHKAIAAVKRQDDRAVAAANRVEQMTAKCDETSGYWDVVSQNCRLATEDK